MIWEIGAGKIHKILGVPESELPLPDVSFSFDWTAQLGSTRSNHQFAVSWRIYD